MWSTCYQDTIYLNDPFQKNLKYLGSQKCKIYTFIMWSPHLPNISISLSLRNYFFNKILFPFVCIKFKKGFHQETWHYYNCIIYISSHSLLNDKRLSIHFMYPFNLQYGAVKTFKASLPSKICFAYIILHCVLCFLIRMMYMCAEFDAPRKVSLSSTICDVTFWKLISAISKLKEHDKQMYNLRIKIGIIVK